MKRKRSLSAYPWLIAAGLVAVGLFLLPDRDLPEAADHTSPSDLRPADDQGNQAGSSTADLDPIDDPFSNFNRQIEAMAKGRPGQRLAIWQALHLELLAGPPARSTEFIEAFLASGVRVPTGNPFVVGKAGALISAPNLRTLLLDTLDTLNPGQARREARHILESPKDPNDWAISLRIVSRSAPPADPYLTDRVLQHLQVEAWLAQPVVGYLQAFDAAVYVEASAVTRRLLAIADGDNPVATRYAARLALERKAEAGFASVGPLIAEPGSLDGEPKLHAALMARADIRSEADRTALETYLEALPGGSAEASAFARSFPNYNQQVSDNLITTDRLTSIEDRMAQDRATLFWIREIRDQPGFADIRKLLETVEQRLVRYLEKPPEKGVTRDS